LYWPWDIYGSPVDEKDLKKILDAIEEAGKSADFQLYQLSGRDWDKNEFNENIEAHQYIVSMQVSTLSYKH